MYKKGENHVPEPDLFVIHLLKVATQIEYKNDTVLTNIE